MSRYELTYTAWWRLKLLSPPRRPVVGRPGRNHGIIMVNTMLQLPNNGAPWRGMPERYDPRRTAATRVLLVDRGYTGRAVCDYRRRRSIMAIIPQLSTETRARLMDWPNYRERNSVERLIGRLK